MSKSIAKKIRIIESVYIEKSDLIKWRVVFLDENEEQIYVWPSIDLLKSLNIKGPVASNILHDFCNKMINKEINFVIDSMPPKTELSITNDQYECVNDQIISHFENVKKALGEN